MKKIVLVLAVLLALVTLPVGSAYADPSFIVSNFNTHLSSVQNYQGEVQFTLTPCGSGLNYNVVLESIPDGIVPVIHLHLQGIKGPVGTLDGQGMLLAWNSYPVFPPYIYDSPTLLVPPGMKASDLYITDQYDEYGQIHYKQLQPLVENWLVPGKAFVDVHILENGKPGQVILMGVVTGQYNGEWPGLAPFVLTK